MLFFGAELGVGGFVEKAVEFGGIGQLDLDDPVLDGVLVDEARIVDELFVLLEHGTADGRDEVAGGLDALYSSEFFACDDVVTLIGHIDIDDVAESVLCVVSDSDEADVAVDAHVFVGGGIVGFHLVGNMG